MALLRLIGRKDLLHVPNEKAIKVKEIIMRTPKGESVMVDLGIWFGDVREVKSIEMQPERAAERKMLELPEPKLTPEQVEQNKKVWEERKQKLYKKMGWGEPPKYD